MKVKLKLLLLSISISALFLTACSWDDEGEVYIPNYQEAIYIMDADGSNKTKVIDVDGCDNVQFIPNSNKLLYLANNSLYTVNIDGTANVKVSEDVEVEGTNRGNAKPTISNGGNYALFSGITNNQHDLFLYEIGSNSLTNVTNTNSVDELNPRFASDELKACFITRNDSLHYLTVIEPLNSNIDTLYTSSKRMPACLYSFDNQSIFFFEEYDGNRKLVINTQDRESYKATVKRIFISSLEQEIIAENSGLYLSMISVTNENYIIFGEYTTGYLIIKSLINENQIRIENGNISHFWLTTNNHIYYNSSNFIDRSVINWFKIDNNVTNEIADDALAPSLNEFQTNICYISRYLTNPKSRNLITN